MAFDEVDNLDSLRLVVEELRCRISAPEDLLPTYNKSRDLAYPHIEHDSRGFHYVVVERGKEQSRVTTQDVDELLYLIFQNVTFTLACSYEIKHRIGGEDSRRQLFTHQLGLLEQLNSSWRRRREEQINSTLKDHPFDDLSGMRVDYCVHLRNTTMLTKKEIWETACEKFPLPKVKSLA
jgi:Immunity protein 63